MDGEADLSIPPQKQINPEVKPVRKLFAEAGLFLLFSIVSIIIFGLFNLPALALMFLFVCGDSPCSFAGSLTILIYQTTSLINYALPGIFLYSVIFKHWKLPLVPLILLVGTSLFGILLSVLKNQFNLSSSITGSIRYTGLLQTLLTGPIWFVFMLLVYFVTLFTITRLVHGLIYLNSSKKAQLVLITELLLFSIVIAITSIMPKTLQKVERATSPTLKTSNLPFGNIYYYFYNSQTQIKSTDSQGRQKSFQTNCQEAILRETLISWDQRSAICVSNSNQSWLINTTTNTSTPINLEGQHPYSQYSWSTDGKYLALSTNSLTNVSNLNVFNFESMRTEKLNENPFSGYINNATFSPDNQVIAFTVNTHTTNNNYLRKIEVVNLNSRLVNDISTTPACDGTVDCDVEALQFSSDGTHLFYATETLAVGSDYLENLVLVDLTNNSAKETKATSKYGFLGSAKVFIFDGRNTLIYQQPLSDVSSLDPSSFTELDITTGVKTQVNINQGSKQSLDSVYLALNGEWVFYTIPESGSEASYVEKLGSTERFRIFNNTELPLTYGASPPLLYWFR